MCSRKRKINIKKKRIGGTLARRNAPFVSKLFGCEQNPDAAVEVGERFVPWRRSALRVEQHAATFAAISGVRELADLAHVIVVDTAIAVAALVRHIAFRRAT